MGHKINTSSEVAYADDKYDYHYDPLSKIVL